MRFFNAALSAVKRNGIDLVYNVITSGVYNVELGKSTTTSQAYTKRMYPKQVVANQYNYPNLVGKEIIEFYLVNDNLGFVPKPDDTIEYKSQKYRISQVREHFADGMVVLYKLIGVKS